MITLQEMYFALVNSVATALTGAIGAADTTLYVLDDSRIPDPPNLLVLGENSALAETVKLLEKDGTKLTVQRGFQGSARAWNEGTTIARNFTAHDADTFKRNIEMLADCHNALHKKHDALKTAHDTLSDDVSGLREDTDKLRNDADSLRSDADKLRDDSDKLRDDTDNLHSDTDNLRRDYDELDGKHGELSGKLSDHENAELPHIIKVLDGEELNTYHYGFRVDYDGTLVFIWDQEEQYE